MDSTLRSSISLASVLMVVMALAAGADNSKDKEECAESLVGLATCLPYVGGTAKSPTPDCCNGLKQLLNTNKKCLCVVIKDRNDPDLGLDINVTLALALPRVCNAPANISQCPALLKLPPNSPDAQVFYQLAHSPTGGPTASVVPNPTSSPAGAATVSPPNNGGCGKGKRRGGLGAEIFLLGLFLLPALIV